MGLSGPALDPLRAVLDFMGESVGVSNRMSSRPAPEDRVGSYISDLVSNQKYGDYPDGGSVGPNLCGDWE